MKAEVPLSSSPTASSQPQFLNYVSMFWTKTKKTHFKRASQPALHRPDSDTWLVERPLPRPLGISPPCGRLNTRRRPLPSAPGCSFPTHPCVPSCPFPPVLPQASLRQGGPAGPRKARPRWAQAVAAR